VQPPNELRVEDGAHRLHCLELVLHRQKVSLAEHPCMLGGGVRVVREEIPPTELELIEPSERGKVANLDAAVALGGVRETNGSELREGSDRGSEAATDERDPRYRRCGDRTDTGQQDGELSTRRPNLRRSVHIDFIVRDPRHAAQRAWFCRRRLSSHFLARARPSVIRHDLHADHRDLWPRATQFLRHEVSRPARDYA
jgi:hypothetical protein